MDAQIDHAAGMPIGLLDELSPAISATESLYSVVKESQEKGDLTDQDLPRGF
jgi:hypothetical protein